MKPLLGLLVMDRPQTTQACLEHLFRHTERSKYELVVMDQNSGAETKELLKKYKGGFDALITNEFNIGIIFGFNKIFSMRKPGQHCIKLDNDCLIQTDWLPLFEKIIEDPDIGTVLGRRPTFWIDGEGRREFFFQNTQAEERHGIWCELVDAGGLIGCFWMIKSQMLDELGYFNEATYNDDGDYCVRILMKGKRACYIPDAVILQPQNEIVTHPQAMATKELIIRRSNLLPSTYSYYKRTGDLYQGTRFIPQTMMSAPATYTKLSDDNWEFFKNYGKTS